MSAISTSISKRAYGLGARANSWEEIWEAGPYFDRVADLLEVAKNYAVIVGWQIDSRVLMKRPYPSQTKDGDRPEGSETLKQKILRICKEKPNFQFYILMWDHSYFYALEREAWQGRIWENIHPQVHFIFDSHHPFGGSHHEKICIFDGKVVLCGGVDLCDERWDSPHHLYFDPRRSLNWKKENHGPYHDLAVQVTGPICTHIQEHIKKRWDYLSDIPFPLTQEIPKTNDQSQDAVGNLGHLILLSRTIASVEKSWRENATIREVEFLFRDLIQSAQNRIILEGQYYWSKSLNALLIAKIREMAGRPFEIYLILSDPLLIKSLTRYMAAYELNLLKNLSIAAEQAGVSLIMGCPFAIADSVNQILPPKPIYIHSKIIVIDDRYLSIGSANFATRAFRVDTELHLTFVARDDRDRAHVSTMGDRVLKHWKVKAIHNERLSSIQFRPLKPELLLNQMRATKNKLWLIPWQIFFDPDLPWTYTIKIRLYRILTRNRATFVLFIILVWLLSAQMAWRIAGGPNLDSSHLGVWPFLYCLVLSATWILPVYFCITVGICIFHLGAGIASEIAVSTLWVSAMTGYFLARVFPVSMERIFQLFQKNEEFRKMNRRSFDHLLRALLSPRIDLRSKIIGQGLRNIPFAWFFFGTGILLPSILYTISRWLVPAWAPWVSRIPGFGTPRGLAMLFVLTQIYSMVEFIPQLRRFLRSKE